jgi:Cu/Ag efflux pump CusA
VPLYFRTSHHVQISPAFCLSRRAIVVVGLLLFAGAGLVAFKMLNIEAYPNPTPVILEITAQAPGLSAEEMERYYTIPMEIGLYTTPGIDVIRSTSFYGLSFVRVSFKYGVDYNFAYAQASVAMQQNVNLPGNLRFRPSRRTARPARSIAIRSSARSISESPICARCRIGSSRAGC